MQYVKPCSSICSSCTSRIFSSSHLSVMLPLSSPLSYPANDVATLVFIDLCLTRDFFREPEADLGCVKRLVNMDVIWEIYDNCSSVGSYDWPVSIPFVIQFPLMSVGFLIFTYYFI